MESRLNKEEGEEAEAEELGKSAGETGGSGVSEDSRDCSSVGSEKEMLTKELKSFHRELVWVLRSGLWSLCRHVFIIG